VGEKIWVMLFFFFFFLLSTHHHQVVSTFTDNACLKRIGLLSFAPSACVSLSLVGSQRVFASVANASLLGNASFTYSNFVVDSSESASTACSNKTASANCTSRLGACSPCFDLFVKIEASASAVAAHVTLLALAMIMWML